MLSVHNLSKRLGSRTILREVSFTLEAGNLLTITGVNGAGKTTLLRLLAGISRPSSGKIIINGQPLEPSRPGLRRKIGYVGHELQIYPDMSGYENLEFFATAYGVSSAAKRINETLEFWGLADVQHQLVRTYSRGMRQRLSLGRAALHAPSLLLLDEPSAGLDADAHARLYEFLHRHRREGGVVILTTHDPSSFLPLGGLSAQLTGSRLVIDR